MQFTGMVSKNQSIAGICRIRHRLPSFVQQMLVGIRHKSQIHSGVHTETFLVFHARTTIGTLPAQTLIIQIVTGIQVLIPFTCKVYPPFEFVSDLRPAFHSLSGRYQNNTVIGTGTINSCRSRIFQHLYGFNVRGIDIIHRTDNAIYDYQRAFQVLVYRSAATQNNVRRTARFARSICHAQPADRSLQGLCRITHSCILQHFIVQFRNRIRHQRSFLTHTITGHHDLIQHFRIFF